MAKKTTKQNPPGKKDSVKKKLSNALRENLLRRKGVGTPSSSSATAKTELELGIPESTS